MFYYKNLIETKLRCPICKHRYSNPRLLPCGETVCFECISKREKCKLCSEYHEESENGFPLNRLIIELLEMVPIQVSRGVLFDRVSAFADKLYVQLNDLEEKYLNSERVFETHCDLMINEVDVRCDSLIEEVNKVRDKIINELNDYKQNLGEKSLDKSIASYLKSGLARLKNIKTNLEVETCLNEKNLNDWQKELLKIDNDYNFYEYKLKYNTFSGKLIDYNTENNFKNFNIEDLLPKIDIKSMNQLLNIQEFNGGKFIKISLEDYTRKDLHLNPFEIDKLSNSRLVVCFRYYDPKLTQFSIEIFIFKYDLNLKKMIKLSSVYLEKRRLESVLCYNDQVFVSTIDGLNHIISIYSDSLKETSFMKIDDYYSFFCVKNNFVYKLHHNDPSIYSKYNYIKRVNENVEDKFDELKKLSKDYQVWNVFTDNKKLYFTNQANDKMIVFNEETQKIEKVFQINTSNCEIRLDDIGRLIIIDRRTKVLRVYKDNNHLFKENDNINLILEQELLLPENFIDSFCISNDGYLVCANMDTISLSFFK